VSTPDPAAALAAAADHLRESAGHVDGVRASYGDTPLDGPVADFAEVWTGLLLAASEIVAQLGDYTEQAEGAP
jgi:hypothetical protein